MRNVGNGLVPWCYWNFQELPQMDNDQIDFWWSPCFNHMEKDLKSSLGIIIPRHSQCVQEMSGTRAPMGTPFFLSTFIVWGVLTIFRHLKPPRSWTFADRLWSLYTDIWRRAPSLGRFTNQTCNGKSLDCRFLCSSKIIRNPIYR